MHNQTFADNILDLPGGGDCAATVRRKNPLQLAYVGDAVHSLYVRTRLDDAMDCPSGRLHALSVAHLSAAGQAGALAAMMTELTQEELALVRRGRNAKPTSLPKSADIADYHSATAFEALLGYLYLTRSGERLREILDQAYTWIDAQRRKKDVSR